MAHNKQGQSDHMKIGIEAMAFDIPAHYMDMTELAMARGVDPLSIR
jgi:3-hydroxy-3-methylglutaryl CoA synthase